MSDPSDWSQDAIDEVTLGDDDADDGEQDINCSLMADGHCSQAGTEWCDWSCPHSAEANHNKRWKNRTA